MHTRALTLLATILAACATVPRRGDGIVVPTGDGALYRFTADEVSVVSDQGRSLRSFPNLGGSAPRCAGVDLVSGRAVVACERALAIHEMRGATEPGWARLAEPFRAECLALRGDRCALLGRGAQALVVGLPDGQTIWRGSAGVRLDVVHLVVPYTADEHLVIGMRGETVLAQPVSHRRGTPELAGETPVPNMNVFGAAATAGQAIFIAGLREETTASSRLQMQQWLVISKLDPESFRLTEVVYERSPALEAKVLDMAVGEDMVAIAFWMYDRGTRLRVYDGVIGRRPASWSFDRAIPDGSAIAWLATDAVAAVPPAAAAQVFRINAAP